jgi:hypothetical protein
MSMRTVLCFCVMLATCLAGDKKPTITNQAGNERVDIFATPLLDEKDIREALGTDLPKGVVAVQMKVAPRGEKPLSISRDDFTLLSHKDGQRSGAFEPSQIAGSATLVVSTTSEGGAVASQPMGPVWGGIPGTGGRPTMAGPSDGMNAGTAGGTESAHATVQQGDKKENPLMKALAAKMLPDKESLEPVSGLLYFPLDGKVKIKDLELIYKGPAGRLTIEFR